MTEIMFCLICIALCAFLFGLFDWFSRDARLMRRIPGPRAWPIIGNSTYMLGSPEKAYQSQRSLRKKYGTITQIYAMSIRIVFVSNTEDLDILMTSSEYLTKADPYTFAEAWLGDGLLLSSGKKWHQRRKLLTKAFHFNILKKYMVTFKQETERFVKQLEKEVANDKTDIFSVVGPAALRVISDTAMGVSLGSDSVQFKKYFNSVVTMGESLMVRLSKVWLHNDFIFNLSKIAKVQKSVVVDLHAFTKKVIKNKRRLLDENSFERASSSASSYENYEKTALLDLLLENEKTGFIDSEGIREEVDTFMFEGYDTTTVTISFFILAIANEPAIQDKIYEELQQIMGDSHRSPTMEELNDMKYLDCCIKESLRLYPTVPMIGRKLFKDTVLSGYTVPANTTCMVSIYDLHRCEDTFPEPERFNPDRFLPENSISRNVYSYIPFSAGLRNCIGQKFAMLEMKMLLSGLMRRFRLDPVTRPSEIVYVSDIVLRPKYPMYVRFRSRN